MLTLTRKVGESIYIGKDIVIYVKEIKGKQVRIGVDASLEFPVYRGEIYERIMEENKLSSKAPVSMDEITSLFKSAKSRKESSIEGGQNES